VSEDCPRLHLVGHAHIDPAWLWRWPEGMAEVLATFRSALDRIAEHPEFVFSCGSAAFYAFVESADPAMFAEISSAVAAGRWEVLGGFWVEPDTNVTSGEALVRHVLHSQRYFASRFGAVPTVAFNPDAFGHCAGLPQILARSGFDSYVFMRPEPAERALPFAFTWASDDGSTVGAHRIPVSYCTWPETLEHHLAAVREALAERGMAEGMCFYGVGNHGGGPTQSNLALLDARIEGGAPLVYSSPHRYVVLCVTRESVVRGELGFHARGAYSAHSAIKAAIRRTDAALVGAEVTATLGTLLLGRPYPAGDLNRAWRELLCAGFHDVAAGTVIASAAQDALAGLCAAAWTAERVTADAQVALAWHTALSLGEGEHALVVFNQHPWSLRAPVETEVGADAGELHLVDDAGREVAIQEVCSEAVATGRRRITFLASVPACGWSVYRLSTTVAATDRPTQTARWQLEVDADTGGISTLCVDGNPVLAGPSAYVAVGPDDSDTWSHGVTQFGPETARFRLESVDVVEDGPVRRVVRTIARHGDSTVTQDFLLHHEWDRVLVHVLVHWAERHSVAKLRFATEGSGEMIVEAPYATVRRPADGHEYPGGAWISAPGAAGRTGSGEGTKTTSAGYCIANDAKFGYDSVSGSCGITIARSPLSAHHDPTPRTAETGREWLDQGEQRFTYAIAPHSDPGAAARVAAELLRPARLVAGSHHPDAPLVAGVAQLTVRGANLGAVKRAADGRGTVVRVHNPEPRAHAMEMCFGSRVVRRVLQPSEILTTFVPDRLDRPVTEVDLLERTLGEEPKGSDRRSAPPDARVAAGSDRFEVGVD
jgi:alpha-mannosidase